MRAATLEELFPDSFKEHTDEEVQTARDAVQAALKPVSTAAASAILLDAVSVKAAETLLEFGVFPKEATDVVAQGIGEQLTACFIEITKHIVNQIMEGTKRG